MGVPRLPGQQAQSSSTTRSRTPCRCWQEASRPATRCPQALDNVAKESGGPFGEELNRALLESRLGLPIEDALEGSAQRMDSRDFHWVVMAIRINRKVGGNLAEVLTIVGQTLRERERLRRQVQDPHR